MALSHAQQARLIDRIESEPNPLKRRAMRAEAIRLYAVPEQVEAVSLRDHLLEVDPGPHRDWWHVRAMEEAGQAVLDGEILRLMVHAPPRYYKSRTCVQGVAGCHVRNTPGEFVGLLFASDKLARFHSQHARDQVMKAGVELRQDSKDKSLWMVKGHHGGLYISTIRVVSLGFGWRLGIVDDPMGSYEEAQSRTIQELAEKAFDAFKERMEKGFPVPRIIVMHQRLGARELAGRLYEREADAARAEGWTVLDLAAEKRRRRNPYPPTCTVLLDPRAIGEALCPELEGVEKIRKRSDANPFRAASVDGQEPLEAAGGGKFRRSWMPLIGVGRSDLDDQRGALQLMANEGEIAHIIGWWRGHDFSAGGRDATTDTMLARLEPGRGIEFVWLDMAESHPPAAGVMGTVLARARRDAVDVIQVIPVEVGTGKTLSSSLALDLRAEGYTVEEYTQTKAKVPRAQPHMSACASSCAACGGLVVKEDEAEALGKANVCKCAVPVIRPGRVAVLAGPMAERFREEHHDFDGEDGGDDDLVDSASGAFNIAAPPMDRRLPVPRPSVAQLPGAVSASRRKALKRANW